VSRLWSSKLQQLAEGGILHCGARKCVRLGPSEVDLDAECRELRVEGELDLSVADQLQRRLEAAAVEDVEVLICLERCDFIDSTGIAAIVMAHKLLASRGRRLLVCNPLGQVSRVLALTGLNDAGLVHDSTDAALAERFGHAVSRAFREEESLQKLPD
jgi:anti-sigma B factor antagonist